MRSLGQHHTYSNVTCVQISASEKLAQSKLDMATNRLLTAGVVFGAGSMCFAFGGFGASLIHTSTAGAVKSPND